MYVIDLMKLGAIGNGK